MESKEDADTKGNGTATVQPLWLNSSHYTFGSYPFRIVEHTW